MTSTEPDRAQHLFPTLRCKDADALIGWLRDVVGFREHLVHREDGAVSHAELALGGSILMLGQERADDYGALVGSDGGRRTDALYAAVADADLDGLHARVAASGVAIEMALHDTGYGSREFTCRDPEGNLWSFGTYRPRATDGAAGA